MQTFRNYIISSVRSLGSKRIISSFSYERRETKKLPNTIKITRNNSQTGWMLREQNRRTEIGKWRLMTRLAGTHLEDHISNEEIRIELEETTLRPIIWFSKLNRPLCEQNEREKTFRLN